MPKRIMKGSVGGRPSTGKPRNIWEDEVRKYAIKQLNTKELVSSGKTQKWVVKENKGDHGQETGRSIVGGRIWQGENYVATILEVSVL